MPTTLTDHNGIDMQLNLCARLIHHHQNLGVVNLFTTEPYRKSVFTLHQLLLELTTWRGKVCCCKTLGLQLSSNKFSRGTYALAGIV